MSRGGSVAGAPSGRRKDCVPRSAAGSRPRSTRTATRHGDDNVEAQVEYEQIWTHHGTGNSYPRKVHVAVPAADLTLSFVAMINEPVYDHGDGAISGAMSLSTMTGSYRARTDSRSSPTCSSKNCPRWPAASTRDSPPSPAHTSANRLPPNLCRAGRQLVVKGGQRGRRLQTEVNRPLQTKDAVTGVGENRQKKIRQPLWAGHGDRAIQRPGGPSSCWARRGSSPDRLNDLRGRTHGR